MKQLYYAIQTILHRRGANITKIISLSLGLTIGILLFSRIALEFSFEQCYPEAERLVLVRGGSENIKTGEKNNGYDESLFAPLASAMASDLPQLVESATTIFYYEQLSVYKEDKKLNVGRYANVDTCYFRTMGIDVLN